LTKQEFWSGYQPGFRLTRAPVGSREFFDEVSARRYSLEPHIAEIAQFEHWSGRRVLEAGCGIGTDGARFAAAGAHYAGVDFSDTALKLARRRFDLESLEGRFAAGSVTELPVRDATFDLVFSHGVIHHIEHTDAAVREFHRVLKPGGTAVVMVYHRRSLNYYLTIMGLRRMLAALLLLPRGPRVVSRLTHEREDVIAGHRALLASHGIRYLLDANLFLSHNTDGPGNPLSKVFSRPELERLFSPGFRIVKTEVRNLNLRLYPGGARFAGTRGGRRLERTIGWHLYIEAVKVPAHSP
jgi:2-polyprenyl-3-methyl-5-hydroxy-6-metoxy-1,4-benzoquinol methylase